eukprot:6177542-Pleurochrysis_carterae.AAC.2
MMRSAPCAPQYPETDARTTINTLCAPAARGPLKRAVSLAAAAHLQLLSGSSAETETFDLVTSSY